MLLTIFKFSGSLKEFLMLIDNEIHRYDVCLIIEVRLYYILNEKDNIFISPTNYDKLS